MKPYNIQTLSVDINGQQVPVQCFTIRKGNYNYQYAQAEINGEKVEGVSSFTNRNWEEYDYQKAIQNLKNNIGENIVNESKLKRIIRQTINEAVNGGWKVETGEAQEAYNLAVNILGKETIDDAIIRAMGDTQLAEILAYVFRMYDFTEWKEYKNETLEPREPYADFGEMYESMEYEDYTPEISEIASQCGYSITDSYDKWNGVVYVLDKERKNACPETELKDKILSSIGEVEVKFGKRTSPQAPEMSKLLLYVETPYQEELA